MNKPQNWYAKATEPIYNDQRVQEQLHCDMRYHVMEGIMKKNYATMFRNIIHYVGAKHQGSGSEFRILFYDN